VSQIFVSHSSKNNPAAIALHGWLRDSGLTNVFLDIDVRDGISPGEQWEKALQDACDRCEAVLFLVSNAWLASPWCLDEFRLTRHLRKKPFGVVIEDVPFEKIPTEMTREWQLCDLSAVGEKTSFDVSYQGGSYKIDFSADGLTRLRLGLEKAGLSATSFAFDPKRIPYPGLRPLEEDDAAILFGRDAQIVTALDEIRGLRESGQKQIFVVLGASGTGKSSFLRAGLLPRLRRDDRNFLAIPAVRPETAVLTGVNGLASSIAGAFKALNIDKSRGHIRSILEKQESFVGLLDELRQAARKRMLVIDPQTPLPTVIIPIDQAEELFNPAGAKETTIFLSLLNALKTMRGGGIAIATIRSDKYELLQKNEVILELAQQPFNLSPIPVAMYSEIVDGPAERRTNAGKPLVIDAQLKTRLLSDVAGEGDALPLIAFTLHRLFVDYGAGGKLKLDEYENLGGVKGSIAKTVEAALSNPDHPPVIPADDKEQEEGLRRVFIPQLVRLDGLANTPLRQVAREAAMPPASRAFVDRLVRSSILTRDTRDGITVVEIAHEALLRQWDMLRRWLDSAAADLRVREGIKRAAIDWDANARAATWLVHKDIRLAAAKRILSDPSYLADIGALGEAYVDACNTIEADEKNSEIARLRKDRRRDQIITYGSVIATLLMGIFGWIFYEQWRETEQVRAKSDHNLGLTLLVEAENALKRERPMRAFTNASIATGAQLPGSDAVQRPLLDPGTDAFVRARTIADVSRAAAVLPLSEVDVKTPINAVSLSPAGDLVVFAGENQRVVLIDIRDMTSLSELSGYKERINSIKFGPDGRTVAVAGAGRAILLWDTQTSQVAPLCGHKAAINELDFHPSGKWLASAGSDGLVQVWDVQTHESLKVFADSEASIESVKFSADGLILGYSDSMGNIITRRTDDWSLVKQIKAPETEITTIAFSGDGKQLITATYSGVVQVWSLPDGKLVGRLPGDKEKIWRIAFAGDRQIATAAWDGVVRLWDTETLEQTAAFDSHDSWVTDVAFDSTMNIMATGSQDGRLRIWDVSDRSQFLPAITDHKQDVIRAAYSGDGRIFGSGGIDRQALIYQVGESGRMHQICEPIGHPGWILGLSVSADGRILASAGTVEGATGNGIVLTDTRSCTSRRIEVDSAHIMSLTMSPDGKLLAASLDDDGTVRLYSVADLAETKIFQDHQGTVFAVSFDPSGRYFASAGKDRQIIIRQVSDGRIIRKIPAAHAADIWFLQFSPDGRLLASGGAERPIRIWEWQTGSKASELSTATSAAGLVFSSDGKWLVIGDDNRSLTAFDTATWAPKAILSALVGVRGPLAADPRTARISFHSEGGAVRFWDLRTIGSGSASFIQNAAMNVVQTRPPGIEEATRAFDIGTSKNMAAGDSFCIK
jgi:WD40 repeat protein